MFDMLEPPSPTLDDVPVGLEEFAPDDLDGDGWTPDPGLEAAACALLTEREDVERADARVVDRLDVDATLWEVDVTRRQVNLAEMRLLDLACHWADLHAVSDRPGGPTAPGTERLVTPGGDGTPAVLEFAPAELAVALQVSDTTAAALLTDGLDLRHRFPALWDRLHTGDIPVWTARKTAQLTRSLSQQAAASVDEQVARFHGHLTWARLKKAVDAAILHADPPKPRPTPNRPPPKPECTGGPTTSSTATAPCSSKPPPETSPRSTPRWMWSRGR